jgi:hypothetical protein
MVKFELIQWLLKLPKWRHIKGINGSLYTFDTLGFDTIKIRLKEIS